MTSPAFSDTTPRSLSQVRRFAADGGFSDVETEALVYAYRQAHLPVLCWDLDSTIADNLHRQPMIDKIKAGECTWDDYSLACPDDKLIHGTAWLMYLLDHGHRHFILTGRSEVARELTEEWLGVRGVKYDRLIMRQPGDHRPNPKLKVAMLDDLVEEGLTVTGYFDDWPAAAAAVRKAFPALPVVVLNPCYPEGAPHGN